MGIAVVTGSAGLIGSEATRHFANLGMDVVGVDNDLRKTFFGNEASTHWQRLQLSEQLGKRYVHFDADIRDINQLQSIFKPFGNAIELVIHTAAQPSHDWAASNPQMDFTVNANGTLNLLQATRDYCSDATFIFTSTNKVYGDRPNALPLVEQTTRWEIDENHPFAVGIDESMSIDQTMHSLFGASKVAADVLVQEYGRYFGMKTASFRGGCLTGPNHSGTQLHGFLAYLMKCTMTGTPYEVFGYQGKQVRDNIHSFDLVQAFDHFHQSPRCGEVYNIGGGRFSHCSMMEAITICQSLTGNELDYRIVDQPRMGDHQWYVSDLSKFQSHYPQWRLTKNVTDILGEIYEHNSDRWKPATGFQE